MLGINAHTGQTLAGLDHLRQSIADILSTPLNTRVMRRDYGSRLPELIDQPITPRLAVELYAATAAMKKTGVVIIQANMRRCIEEAADDQDKSIEEFQKALTRFIGMS